MVEIWIDKYQDKQINSQIDRKMVEILRDIQIDLEILEGWSLSSNEGPKY